MFGKSDISKSDLQVYPYLLSIILTCSSVWVMKYFYILLIVFCFIFTGCDLLQGPAGADGSTGTTGDDGSSIADEFPGTSLIGSWIGDLGGFPTTLTFTQDQYTQRTTGLPFVGTATATCDYTATATAITLSNCNAEITDDNAEYSIFGNILTIFGLQFTNPNIADACDTGLIYDGTGCVAPPSVLTWTARVSGTTGDLDAIAYADDTWVAVGSGGTIRTATDPTGTWTARTSDTTGDLDAIAYADDTWVAVGSGGTIRTATDPTGTWTARSEPFELLGIAYKNDTWVAVGVDGTILTSANLTAWTSRTSGTGDILFDIAYADSTWVIVGGNFTATILTATDPTSTWTSRTSGTGDILFDIAYADSTWVAVGWSGTILATTDPTSTWVARASGTDNRLNGIAYGDGIWVAVGGNGTILTAP